MTIEKKIQLFRNDQSRDLMEAMTVAPMTPEQRAGLTKMAQAGYTEGDEVRILVNLPGFSLTHAWLKRTIRSFSTPMTPTAFTTCWQALFRWVLKSWWLETLFSCRVAARTNIDRARTASRSSSFDTQRRSTSRTRPKTLHSTRRASRPWLRTWKAGERPSVRRLRVDPFAVLSGGCIGHP